jgi:hypothetical protein
MTNVRLLDEAIAAHGGLARWAQVQQITLQVRIGGNILALRFKSPRTRVLECTVDTRRIHALLKPFPRRGLVGIFGANHIRIQTDQGRVVDQRTVTRDATGRVPRRLFWNDLDVLSFLGYSLWNYTVIPYVFLWSGFECREGQASRQQDGSSWQTLRVRYPAGFPTHSREQTFYFDQRSLLRRIDYTADVFGPFARGAHMCEAHRTFDGLVVPTHRVVYARRASGAPLKAIRVMEGWIEHVVVT